MSLDSQSASVRKELLAVQSGSDDGMLHCADVVEWARVNPGSVLYSKIEWDDERAADAHRLWQVRRLIQLHVVSDQMAETMVSLSIDRKAGGGYRSVSDVVARPDLREIMLQDALADLERLQQRYSRVEALASVWREASVARVKARRARPNVDMSEQMAAAD